jgi:hypothetical protein
VNPSIETKDQATKKVKSEISSELQYSDKIQVNNAHLKMQWSSIDYCFLIFKRVTCPEFCQMMELLNTGTRLFPSYLWHVLKSLPLSNTEFREHFQVKRKQLKFRGKIQ